MHLRDGFVSIYAFVRMYQLSSLKTSARRLSLDCRGLEHPTQTGSRATKSGPTIGNDRVRSIFLNPHRNINPEADFKGEQLECTG